MSICKLIVCTGSHHLGKLPSFFNLYLLKYHTGIKSVFFTLFVLVNFSLFSIIIDITKQNKYYNKYIHYSKW